MKNIFISIFICAIVAFITSCNEQIKVTVEEKKAPVLNAFSPNEGKVGTEITVEGENLSNVNSVTIGGGKADIKYRIDNNKMVIKVTAESLSGKIKVINEIGESESAENFNITYATPEILSIPQTFEVGSEILIEGNNLEVVSKITFGTDNIEGEITYQSENEILVIVPNVDEANVRLVYFDGTSEQAVTPDNVPEINKPEPIFDSFDTTEANEGTTIDFIGEKLNLIEKIIIGTHEIQKDQFTRHLENIISVTVPEVENDETGLQIKAIYYTDKEKVISENFTIKNVLLYFYENISLGTQNSPLGVHFFNAVTGEAYSPCDVKDNISENTNVYFYTVWSGNAFRLADPSHGTGKSQLNKFKCDNEKLANESFPNHVKFKKLDINDNEENTYINYVKSKTLESIPDNITEILGTPGTSNFNYNSHFTLDDVILFALFDSDGATPIKFGFIHITGVSENITSTESTDPGASITFNCYFQK